MGGRILVKYGSPLRILHASNLGTTTVVTDQTGAELEDELFYPWGQDWTRAGLPYALHFAGMHLLQDAGLYPTPNRDFTPNLGRWMTPDPLGMAAADPSSPQSWNRYAYVTNNPTTVTDPSGLIPHRPLYNTLPEPPCAYCIDVGGNDIFDALGGSPGAYLTMDAYGNLGVGFSMDKWWQDARAQEAAFQNSAAYSNGFQNQLSATTTALKVAGATDTEIAAFVSDNEQAFAAGRIALTGGNFDFIDASNFAFIYQNANMCPHLRCDLGTQGTLDFSHGNGTSTFHLDTADPFSEFGLGLLVHFSVDVIWGNMGDTIIPR